MTTVSGHASSFPSEGEMVGLGARRKVIGQCPADAGRDYDNQEAMRTSEDIVGISHQWLNTECPTRGNFKRRERRHIYHDIVPLKTDVLVVSHQAYDNEKLPEHPNNHNENLKRNMTAKPKIPPKPKYILRDKCLRHVYHTIKPSEVQNGVVPPPLPQKPAHLQPLLHRYNDEQNTNVPPPLPPRVANREALKQRHKLDHEYFENLRKSVDGNLLDLMEEGDLPVPIQPNNLSSSSRPQRHNYGAHSPPLNIPSQSTEWQFPTQSSETMRRHSLPIYESIPDIETSGPPAGRPSLPVTIPRTNSQDFESESSHDFMNCCSKESSEVNLAQNLLLLKSCGWYWGNMTWQEAESLLSEKEGEGVFLMRDSQNPHHLLTVTVRSTTNTVHHVRVEYNEGKFQLYEPGRTVSRSTAMCVRHSNIKQFISLAIRHSNSGSFLYFLKPKNMGEPPVQIRLLSPISRFSKVKSLRYLCRMVIRNGVVPDLVPSIPIPPKIQQYLLAGPYYDPDEDL